MRRGVRRMAGVVLLASGPLLAMAQVFRPGSGARPGDAPAVPVPAMPGGSGAGAAPAVVANEGGGARPAAAGRDDTARKLKFNNAPLQMLLDAYAEATGRILLVGPNIPDARVTLRSQDELSPEEYLEAIERVLGMYGVALIREDDRFLRVVQNADARREPMAIQKPRDGQPRPDSGELISQIVPLKYIDFEDAMKALEPLKHAYGQIQNLEGIRSLMITDSAATVNRLMEVLGLIDRPVDAQEETVVVQIEFAKAADVKRKIEEIIAEGQEQTGSSTVPRQRTSGAPGVERAAPPVPAGVIRPLPGSPQPADAASAKAAAEKGIVQGRVKIVEDERTNKLIIITRPENMVFFNMIIKVLDVETSPDVVVKVRRLEFADAVEVEGMLNDLIGAPRSEDSKKAGEAGTAPQVATGEGSFLRDYAARLTQQRLGAAAAQAPGKKSKIGELSTENIKILADKRTNALIIMASKSDLATLEDIIVGMDTMLAQVLVEAVILEISLDDNVENSVDWVQRALVAYNEGPDGVRNPVAAYAASGGGGKFSPLDPTDLTTPGSFPQGSGGPLPGLSYYLTLFDMNVDAVVRLVANDSRTRILSSPVILTTDNEEATIDVATERYFFKGTSPISTTDGVVYTEDVETKRVGIQLKVLPRINDKKFVVMEIEQKIDNVSGTQKIGDNDWPIVTSRTLDANVAVRSGDTVVMGGLIINQDGATESKIPFLGDIPILGLLFKASRKEKARNEVVVFLTPYVLASPEELMTEADRMRKAQWMEGMWKKEWSNSKLAEDVSPREWRPDGKKKPAEAKRSTASVPAATSDPMQGLDPEARKLIDEESRRWDSTLERLDQRTDGAKAETRKDTLF